MARNIHLPLMKSFSLSEDMAKRIENYRRNQKKLPTESEAIRRLLETGLAVAERELVNAKAGSPTTPYGKKD